MASYFLHNMQFYAALDGILGQRAPETVRCGPMDPHYQTRCAHCLVGRLTGHWRVRGPRRWEQCFRRVGRMAMFHFPCLFVIVNCQPQRWRDGHLARGPGLGVGFSERDSDVDIDPTQ